MKIAFPNTRKRPRIEIIPLIDIIFFLLATFVMVSLSMVRNQGLNVNLPTAATSTTQDRSKAVTITVTEQGDLSLDKEKISFAELAQRLKDLKAQEPELKVFVNADAKAYFESAVKVLDIVRSVGITKVAIQTKLPAV
jgi:biopolymer transport protein ExbD